MRSPVTEHESYRRTPLEPNLRARMPRITDRGVQSQRSFAASPITEDLGNRARDLCKIDHTWVWAYFSRPRKNAPVPQSARYGPISFQICCLLPSDRRTKPDLTERWCWKISEDQSLYFWPRNPHHGWVDFLGVGRTHSRPLTEDRVTTDFISKKN